jgi:hypothetical protein
MALIRESRREASVMIHPGTDLHRLFSGYVFKWRQKMEMLLKEAGRPENPASPLTPIRFAQ